MGKNDPLKADLLRTVETQRSLISKLQRKLEKACDAKNLFIDTIREAGVQLRSVKFPRVKGKAGKSEAVIFADVSDAQIGSNVTLEDTWGLSEYNSRVFPDEVNTWVNKLQTLTKMHRSYYKIDTLVINFLGDIVEGEQIFPGQGVLLDQGTADQVFTGIQYFAYGIRELSKIFPKIYVYTVHGNHGRPAKGYSQRTNFDFFLYLYLMNSLERQENVKFFVSTSPGMIYKVPELPDFTHLIFHGNNINSNLSLPYYGLDRAVGKYVMTSGLDINYIHLGHHHREASIDIAYGKYFVNGSWVGGSSYSVNKLKESGYPKQKVMLFHREHGLICEESIYLRPRRRLEGDKNGICTPYVEKVT